MSWQDLIVSVSSICVLCDLVCIFDLLCLVRQVGCCSLVHYNFIWWNDGRVMWALCQNRMRLVGLFLIMLDLFTRNCHHRAFGWSRHYFKSRSTSRDFRLKLMKGCSCWSHTLNSLGDQKVWSNRLKILFPQLSLFEVLIESIDWLNLWLGIYKLCH